MATHPHVPAYRLHIASGQARVIIDGWHVYLGKYGTPESLERYHQTAAESLGSSANRVDAAAALSSPHITVSQVILEYFGFHHASEPPSSQSTREGGGGGDRPKP